MSSRMIRIGVLRAAVALSVAAAGCSSDDDKASGPTEVKVGLKEWSFSPDLTEAPAGKITFTVENSGDEVHELVLFKIGPGAGGPPAGPGRCRGRRGCGPQADRRGRGREAR